MSPKELMYIDDCLGHLVFFKTLCQDVANELEDKKLSKLVEEIEKKSDMAFKKLYELVGGEN